MLIRCLENYERPFVLISQHHHLEAASPASPLSMAHSKLDASSRWLIKSSETNAIETRPLSAHGCGDERLRAPLCCSSSQLLVQEVGSHIDQLGEILKPTSVPSARPKFRRRSSQTSSGQAFALLTQHPYLRKGSSLSLPKNSIVTFSTVGWSNLSNF